ncbi:DUF6153 family protein [Actinomadura sp. NPDC000600]|uniref:DUF6153 family protein n=1 Tax=Actinomadura sp. NPDC000600 TaxID=3154262 RepID=UPI0033920751
MKLPFGLLMLLCVLAMHGFQASPSPSETAGVPMMAMSSGHEAAPTSSKPLHHPSSGEDQPGDHHQDHPGGQVCLAILTMLSFLAAIVALFVREPMIVARRILARVRILLVGRPPPRPSLHRLCVLRL